MRIALYSPFASIQIVSMGNFFGAKIITALDGHRNSEVMDILKNNNLNLCPLFAIRPTLIFKYYRGLHLSIHMKLKNIWP